MSRGYYRVHMVHEPSGDWITLFVPLDDAGRYDSKAPKPHLAKTSWEGCTYYGEFDAMDGKQHRFVWEGTDPDSLTDLLKVPLQVGRHVVVHEDDDVNSTGYEFIVRDLRRL